MVAVPRSVLPWKYCTLATPAGAVAVAAKATVAGAATVPAEGLVIFTTEVVVAVTFTVTAAEVVDCPALSLATAVSD